jgi:transposase
MSQYTMKQFVEACLSSTTKEEAAKKLGVSPWTVTRVAQKLRKEGVKLPPFGRGAGVKPDVDVDELNALIEEKKGA